MFTSESVAAVARSRRTPELQREIPSQEVERNLPQRGDSEVLKMISDKPKQEIREAIKQAARVPPRIRVLNSRPRFRYLYTCHRCSSHNCSLVHISEGLGADPIKVCSICGNMGNGNANWERELDKRLRHKMQEQGFKKQAKLQNGECRTCGGHQQTTLSRNGNVVHHQSMTCYRCGSSTWRSRQWWR